MPTQVANRAMGDWAENLIINQVNSDKIYCIKIWQ